MKKILSLLIALLLTLSLISCGEQSTPIDEYIFDNPATQIDNYFGNSVRFSNTGTTIEKNANDEYAGKFIKDKVGVLKLKSITDGDTAVFHLNGEADSYSGLEGRSYTYLTVRFLGIDTPESTSQMQPWGKAASDFAKSVLIDAEGIIVDATDVPNGYTAGNRLDSNGTRWLALIWYCPKGGNPQDLSQYRSYQLDMIENCFTNFTSGFTSSRYLYEANKDFEPHLYNEFKDSYGYLTINELLLHAEIRMQKASKVIRVHGETDPNFDYSKTPTQVTIKQAIDDAKRDENGNFVKESNYITRATFLEIKGVIVDFVANNFFLSDAEGNALYVYMGIDGKSLGSLYKQGVTIKLRGRLCEYGGQLQLSGIEFTKESFVIVEEESEKIALPPVVELTGKETSAQLNALIGRLVRYTDTVTYIGNPSKDFSYSLTLNTSIPDLVTAGAQYPDLQVRVNGPLKPGYDYSEGYFKTNNRYRFTGIMSIYSEVDYQKEKNFPSYQIVLANRKLVDGVYTYDEALRV